MEPHTDSSSSEADEGEFFDEASIVSFFDNEEGLLIEQLEKEYEEQERDQKMRLDDGLEGVASLLGMDVHESNMNVNSKGILAMPDEGHMTHESTHTEDLSGIHWLYKTASHAAEVTAGFYNPSNRDGYAAIMAMLKKNGASLNLACADLYTLNQHEDFPEAFSNPEGLVWQVLNAAWDVCLPISSENALPCLNRVGYNKILDNCKPLNDPDGKHFTSFTYLRLSPLLMERHNFVEFERFVKRMHDECLSHSSGTFPLHIPLCD
ncbi:beta-amylase 7 [Senna tora]|uniref:Beta-amylase n=1 Tax=Senna tora TaxID=362788 RepID=A0A834WKW1_9FABA|nr:beta-amylase 7 [Senna tora]